MENESQHPVDYEFFSKCCYCGKRKSPATGKSIARFLRNKGTKVATPCCESCFTGITAGHIDAEIKGLVANTRYHISQVLYRLEMLGDKPDYDVLLGLLLEMKWIHRAIGEEGHEFKRKTKELQIMAQRLSELQNFINSTELKLMREIGLSYKECRRVADRAISDPELRKRIFTRDGYKCLGCGSEELLTVDHIRPVYFNGTNDDDNLQTLCLFCNSKKGKDYPEVGKLKALAEKMSLTSPV